VILIQDALERTPKLDNALEMGYNRHGRVHIDAQMELTDKRMKRGVVEAINQRESF